MGGRPVFILNEDSQRTSGKDAQSMNITAGKAVAESVRTTLGPKGMDKMLVDSSGEVVITNDGVTILDEMDIEHPAASMLVEVAQTQEDEVGDGTTTASVLAGQLLAQAEDLLEQDVHPTTVVQGYAEARDIALEAVEDATIDADDDASLEKVARSSMTGKGTGDVDAETLAAVVVDAVRHVQDDTGSNRDNIAVHAQTGAASSATSLVEGVVVDSGPAREDMPRSVEDADVAVLDGGIEARDTTSGVDVEYNITSPDQLEGALEAEETEILEYAEAVIDAGVDVLFATDDVDERAAARLSKAGVLVFDDVSDDDAGAIATATGATQIGQVEDIDASYFGHAANIRVESYDDDELVFVEGGADANTVTLFVRGSTDHVTDELERAIGDAIDVVSVTAEEGGAVPGAGATEVIVAGRVRERAAAVEGREQLAVEAFADALDVLPRTLAENTGMDPIDALVDLRAANEDGIAGVLALGESGEIADPIEHGVLDPAAVKREAIESATEAATMIARIDDVISAQ